MQRVAGFLGSSIGKKIVMAMTGIMLVGFVVGHMAGNLQLYASAHGGEHPLDAYARMLKEALHGGGIWIARGGLIAAVTLHIWAAIGLTRMNRAARPVGYREQQYQASSLASRWMRVSGIIVAVFIVFHLLHFTTGQVHPNFIEGKVFHNVVEGFRVPWVSAFYIVAMLSLAPHLAHGVWSMLQTLGLSHPRHNKLRKVLATLITAAVILPNLSFPLAVLSGLVHF
jgi:succinate dehydrogenase / fumarate reductase, cytochrome b subunit